jgi:small-conductance mechanosensitive channel
MSWLQLQEMLQDPVIQAGSLAIVGAAAMRILLRHHPGGRLAGQVVLFLALTLLLLYNDIVPYQVDPPDAPVVRRVFSGVAKLLWWTSAAWTLIGFVRVFVIFERQPREARLLQDLVVGAVYLGAVLSVVASVFSVPVGTLIATSGVFAIILGLAMQSTLSDVFSGIALNLGRPYAIGDWIVLSDGIEGRVIETNWRATHLLNGSRDLVVLPNSGLAKVHLTNLSSPDPSHGATVTVRLVPTTNPATILDVMRRVLMSSNLIVTSPEPTAHVKSIDSQAVEVELSFRILDWTTAAAARSEIFDLVYRHVKAAELSLSPPPGSYAEAAGPARGTAVSRSRAMPLRLLDAVSLFSSLTEDEKEALAETMTRRTFRKDEVAVEQGATMNSLMIVRSGVLEIVQQESGRELELAKLAPGDCFGEGGLLTGATEAGSIRALTFVVVYEIAQDGLAPLLHDRPGMVEELGLTLSRRAAQERHVLGQIDQMAGPASLPWLVDRIRHLFQLPHA